MGAQVMVNAGWYKSLNVRDPRWVGSVRLTSKNAQRDKPLPLSSPDRLMGVFGPVVGPETLLVATAETELSAGTAVRGKLVRHEDLRGETLLAEELTHEPESRLRVAPALHQHVEDLAFVVDGVPEPEPLSFDPDHHLVEVPGRTRARASTPEFPRKDRPEFQHPSTDALVGDLDPALSQELLDVFEAQGETQIEPDRVPDDDGWELMASVRDRDHAREPTTPAGVDSRDVALHINDTTRGHCLRSSLTGPPHRRSEPMRQAQFAVLTGFIFLAIAPALAQTTVPTSPAPTPAPVPVPTGGFAIADWWWVILLVLLAAAAIWYFMRGRGRPSG